MGDAVWHDEKNEAWRERETDCEWYPAQKIKQAFQVQEAIANRGLQNEFRDAMFYILGWNVGWELINASPRDRCLAAAMALETKHA